MRTIKQLLFFISFLITGIAFGQDQLLLQWADSVGMVQPVVNNRPPKKYSIKNLDYGMTIAIERTPKGRIWACWVAGGDDSKAFFVLAYSDNDGKKWSDTKVVVDPHNPNDRLERRTLVGTLWSDPLGRLWLFFDQGVTYYDGRNGNWYSICENPDAKMPTWSTPKFIDFGATLQKPTVTSSGEWVLPVSLWPRHRMNIALENKMKESPLKGAYHNLDSLRGAHAYVSIDNGKSWRRRGMVQFPHAKYDEHLIIELSNGQWWMTARTSEGIWQSFSSDKGYSWSAPTPYQTHVDSRHFIMRLISGNLLLIRHGNTNQKLKSRSHMRAFISTDEGKSWLGSILLDERSGISYPTGFQSPDGYIYISYDYLRQSKGEIYMARFNENDIISKAIVSPKGKLKMLISKPGKVEQSAANIAAKRKKQAYKR
ncbi:MAG: sialidase family protein [Bacteroidales bacterium]